MKTSIPIILTAICVFGLLLPAAAQPTTGGTADQNAATPDQSVSAAGGTDTNNTNAPDAGAPPPDATQGQTAPEGAPAENRPIESTIIAPRGKASEAVASAFVPPAHAIGTNQNDLNMDFSNAPLDMVLNYLSDAAGFIVVQEVHVNGYVTIRGNHITKDKAVDLLNSELNLNNYAAIREDQILTIVSKSDAKTSRIPVKIGNDPNSIPNNDEIATWIIPIRFVEARQLASDLSLFVSAQATVVANEAGNSIVVTDTQANIRHLAEIIKAVDDSAEAETEIRVFPLKHANPNDVATELSSIFPSSSGNNAQSPIQFRGAGGGGRGGGFGGRGGGGFGGGLAALFGGGGAANASQQRIQKATQVTAVADSRIQAVIVTAPKDLMNQIAGIMTELDVTSDRDQGVATIQLQNGDPQQVAQVLQNMFGNGAASRGGVGSSANSALMQRAQNSTTTMGQTTTSSGIGGTGIGGGGGRAY